MTNDSNQSLAGSSLPPTGPARTYDSYRPSNGARHASPSNRKASRDFTEGMDLQRHSLPKRQPSVSSLREQSPAKKSRLGDFNTSRNVDSYLPDRRALKDQGPIDATLDDLQDEHDALQRKLVIAEIRHDENERNLAKATKAEENLKSKVHKYPDLLDRYHGNTVRAKIEVDLSQAQCKALLTRLRSLRRDINAKLQTQPERASAPNSEMGALLSTLGDENQALRRQTEEMKRQMDEVKRQLDNQKMDIKADDTKRQMEELKRQNEEMERQYQEVQRQNEDTRHKTQAMQRQIDDGRDLNHKSKREIQELRSEMLAYNERQTEAPTTLTQPSADDDVKQRVDNAMSELREDFWNLSEYMQGRDIAWSEHIASVDTLRTNSDQICDRLDVTEGQVDGYRKSMGDIDNSITKFDHKVNEIEYRVNGMETSMQNVHTEYLQARQDTSKLDAVREDLRGWIAKLDHKINETRYRVGSIETGTQTVHAGHVQTLRDTSKLDTLREELGRRLDETKVLIESIASLQTVQSDKQKVSDRKLGPLAADLITLNAHMEQLQVYVQNTFNVTLGPMRADLDEVTGRFDSVQTDIQTTIQDTFVASAANIRNELGGLGARIQTVQAVLQTSLDLRVDGVREELSGLKGRVQTGEERAILATQQAEKKQKSVRRRLNEQRETLLMQIILLQAKVNEIQRQSGCEVTDWQKEDEALREADAAGLGIDGDGEEGAASEGAIE